MNRKRFLVVGGNPIRSYTGTGTFTSLRSIGATDSPEEAAQLVRDNYDTCAGLIEVFDTEQGGTYENES